MVPSIVILLNIDQVHPFAIEIAKSEGIGLYVGSSKVLKILEK